MIRKLLEPFSQIWTNPAHQLHPQIVHFPIVFLVIEAITLIVFAFRKQPQIAFLSLMLLHSAFWTMPLAILSGLNDVGLDLGAGNPIVLGFRDRWENAFRAQSSVTIHVWLALVLVALTLTRLVWRSLGRDRALAGVRGVVFGLLTKLLGASRCDLCWRIHHAQMTYSYRSASIESKCEAFQTG